MKIGIVNIINSSEYQNLLEEKDSLIRANERLRVNIQSLEKRLKESQNIGMENHKVFCFLMDFYYTVQDSIKKASPTVKEYAERKNKSVV